jgi:threonine dehydrogenase-like Zn-dependent dehydrogenase
MKQIILKKGQVLSEEMPTPICNKNNVLVQNYYSLISAGTETTSINFSKDNIIKKALNYPDKIAKGLNMLKRKGITETFKLAMNFLEFPTPLGYSCAGKVLEVGENIKDIKVGDLVACAGAQNANHAEIVSVPRNLVTKIPDGLDLKSACSASVGAIALHSVRQLDPKIGETVAVIGLGLIGNLVAQILKANGNKVIGIDIDNDRTKKAKELGIDFVLNPNEKNILLEIQKITNNNGVDGTILSASNKESNLINLSLDITRRKGCIVVLGAVGLNIHRNQ